MPYITILVTLASFSMRTYHQGSSCIAVSEQPNVNLLSDVFEQVEVEPVVSALPSIDNEAANSVDSVFWVATCRIARFLPEGNGNYLLD